MEQQANTVWSTGYLPNGLKASFTFVISDPMNAFAEATAYLDKLLADGFTQNEPGLEAGKTSDLIGFILRREKENNDGDITPVIDLYPADERTSHRCVFHYLNNEDDIKQFELATGLKLDSLPVFDGASLERDGKSTANKYITKLATPVTAIHKLNPKYNPEEPDVKKRKQKRLFVRWGAVQNGVSSHEKAVSSVSTAENVERPKKVEFAVVSAFTRLSSTGRTYYVLAGEQYEAITFDPKKIGEDFARKLNDQLAPVGDMTAIGLLQSKDGKSWYDLQDILVPF